MAKTTSTTLALMLALAAAPLMAQTTEEPAKTEEAAPAAPAEDLSLGQEVGGNGVGSTYTSATFEAFEQRCAALAAKYGSGFILSDAVKASLRRHQPAY